MKTVLGGPFAVATPEVITEAGAFRALEGEWGELFAAAPAATPFQSWGWLYSWWEHYGGGPRKLRLVAARDGDGELVGLLPLMAEPVGGAGRLLGPLLPERLLFVGTGVTDYLDAVVRGGREREAWAAFAGALRGMGGWSVADLQEMRPSAAAWGLFDLWDGPKARLAQSTCSTLEARPLEESVAALEKKHRSEARRSLRRADKDGIRTVRAEGTGIGEAAARLVGLHRERWRGRGISGEHLTGRFEGMVVSAARRLSRAGLGGVYESRRGGEVVLSNLILLGKESAYGYMLGTSREAFRGWSYSPLFVRTVLEAARGRDLQTVDLLRGKEDYKDRWCTATVNNDRAVLGRGAAFVLPYAGYYSLRNRAKDYVQSEGSPRRLKGAVQWLRRRRGR